MRKQKIVIAMLLVLSLCFLVACGSISESDVQGTWTAQYEYNGNNIVSTVYFTGAEYAMVTYKDGVLYESVYGDYEIDGKEVITYDNSIIYHGKSMKFKFKNGMLVNNGHNYEK